jgi:hypothetical protein
MTRRLHLGLAVCAIAALVTGCEHNRIPEWGPETRLTDDGASSVLSYWGGGKCIAIDSEGRLHIVWSDNRNGQYEIFHKYREGEDWTRGRAISSSSGLDPSIAAGPSGRLLAGWYWFGYDVFFSEYDGEEWGKAMEPSDCTDENAVYPSVVYDGMDGRHMVWSQGWPADRIVYRRLEQEMQNPCSVVVRSTGHARFPCLVADDGGRIHMCWQDDRDGNTEIYYLRLDAAGCTLPERLTDDPDTSYLPCLGISAVGGLHLVWHDDRDGNNEVYYMYHDGLGWQDAVRLSPADGYGSGTPKIAVDSDDRAYVVWTDYRHGQTEIYFRESGPGGVEWYEEQRLSHDPSESIYPSVAVGGNGAVHVIWQDDRDLNKEIYYRQRRP